METMNWDEYDNWVSGEELNANAQRRHERILRMNRQAHLKELRDQRKLVIMAIAIVACLVIWTFVF